MWEDSDNSSCVINTDYKILWVVNSENYIYKRNALNRAKEVCIDSHKTHFHRCHKVWLVEIHFKTIEPISMD